MKNRRVIRTTPPTIIIGLELQTPSCLRTVFIRRSALPSVGRSVVIDASNDRRFSAASPSLAVPLRCRFDPELFYLPFLIPSVAGARRCLRMAKAGLRMTRCESTHEKSTSHPNRNADNHHRTGASSSDLFANCLCPQIGLAIRRQTVVNDAPKNRRFSASSKSLAVPLRCRFDPELFCLPFFVPSVGGVRVCLRMAKPDCG